MVTAMQNNDATKRISDFNSEIFATTIPFKDDVRNIKREN